MTEKTAQALYRWQECRRKQDGHFDFPAQGFGCPSGVPAIPSGLTLWLPSPVVRRVSRIRGGRVVEEELQSCLDSELMRLRDLAIYTMTGNVPGRLSLGRAAFFNYAIAVLLKNYDLTDQELEQVLNGNSNWHEPMITHLLGGDDIIQRASSLIRRENDDEPPPAKPKNWLRRLLGR